MNIDALGDFIYLGINITNCHSMSLPDCAHYGLLLASLRDLAALQGASQCDAGTTSIREASGSSLGFSGTPRNQQIPN